MSVVSTENKMKISLSSLKHTENFNMFSAIVSINGKKSFLVEHKGGGYYHYTPLVPDGWDIIEKAKAYAKEELQEDFEPLDMLIEKLINRQNAKKFLTRSMKTNILLFEDGLVTEIAIKPSWANIVSINAIYPKAIVMNNLPIEEAITAYLEYSDSQQ